MVGPEYSAFFYHQSEPKNSRVRRLLAYLSEIEVPAQVGFLDELQAILDGEHPAAALQTLHNLYEAFTFKPALASIAEAIIRHPEIMYFAVIGPPGSGKTLTAQSFTRLLEEFGIEVNVLHYDVVLAELKKTHGPHDQWSKEERATLISQTFLKIHKAYLKQYKPKAKTAARRVLVIECPAIGDEAGLDGELVDRGADFLKNLIDRYPKEVVMLALAQTPVLTTQARLQRAVHNVAPEDMLRHLKEYGLDLESDFHRSGLTEREYGERLITIMSNMANPQELVAIEDYFRQRLSQWLTRFVWNNPVLQSELLLDNGQILEATKIQRMAMEASNNNFIGSPSYIADMLKMALFFKVKLENMKVPKDQMFVCFNEALAPGQSAQISYVSWYEKVLKVVTR